MEPTQTVNNQQWFVLLGSQWPVQILSWLTSQFLFPGSSEVVYVWSEARWYFREYQINVLKLLTCVLFILCNNNITHLIFLFIFSFSPHENVSEKGLAMWVNQFPQKMEHIYSMNSQETLDKKKASQNKLNTYCATIRWNPCLHNGRTEKRTRPHTLGHADVWTPTLAHAPLQMNESCNMHRYKRKINVNPSAVSSSPFLFLSPVTFSQTTQERTSNPPTHEPECVRGSTAKQKCN